MGNIWAFTESVDGRAPEIRTVIIRVAHIFLLYHVGAGQKRVVLLRGADAIMEVVVVRGISKVTDEFDPSEVGSKSISKSIVPGPYGKREGECPPSEVYYETPEQCDDQSLSAGPKSCTRFNFEIEPGHWDFIECTSETHSKPFASDPGSRKSSSTTTGGSSSPSKEHSSHSSAPKACLSRIGAHRRSRAGIIQPLLANYTWKEVEAMTERAAILHGLEGLKYLHTGCSPRIIHGNIKSSNIHLTKNLVAKVADFGLSKMELEDDFDNQTHFSTMVKGTPGYFDPAYSKMGRLDEKSDIYSFGVVLLEMITGHKPSDPSADPLFIRDWVKAQSGGLKGIVDSKLSGAYNAKSTREVYTLALKCIDESPNKHPDIRIVVNRLWAAVMLEDNTLQASRRSLRSLVGQT